MSSKLIAPRLQLPVEKADDVRLGHCVRVLSESILPSDARIAIIGFPSDAGVVINDGRAGAAEAPDRIRHWLYRFTPDAERYESSLELFKQIVDLGNLSCSADLAADQDALGSLVSELLGQNVLPVVLGGGHETSFGHFLGYVNSGIDVTIVNIDAHTDVRPLNQGLPHSGSPFRQALDHPSQRCRQYVVAGLNHQAVAASHREWVLQRGGTTLWRDEMDAGSIPGLYDMRAGAVMATFDIDAVDQDSAPGVSAPNPQGLSKPLWLAAAHQAGLSKAVTSFDLVEVNPRFDIDDRTCRLAALTVWEYLRGLALRSE